MELARGRDKLQPPTLHDVIEAKGRIAGHVARTPLHRYIGLEKLLGAGEVYVKHENHQRLGAFKMRGGINLMAQLSPDELERGVATASSGNHGQSIAYAAAVFRLERRMWAFRWTRTQARWLLCGIWARK